jgi:hypothetical protein
MEVMNPANDTDPEHLPTMRRIRRTALVSAIVLAGGVGVASGWRALFALTCAAAVVMINFLWLEEIIEKTLRPTPEVKSWRVFVRVILRFLLLGAALTGTLVFAREEALSVLLGFSIVVIGIMGEAAWALVRSFRHPGH